jgi:3'-5' exoribonuclease
MQHSFLSDVKDNENISGTFAVTKKIPVKKYANGFSFILELYDKTGTMNATYWGPNDENSVADIFDSISVGGFVEISGKGNAWNNKLTISIDGKTGFNIQKVDSTSVDLENFIKKSSRDIPQMIEELHQIVSEINNEHIKKLLESFTNNDDFMKKKYSQAPAGKMWHHDFVGGLLEHVLSLIAMSKTVKQSHPELNLDLLIAACILHDIGKVVEYEILENFSIGITTEGRLFGHLSIGYFMVAKRISEISDFPEDLRLRILHMILSHHRKLDQGSPVVPMFPEAVAFSLIDDADAQSQHMVQVVTDPKEDFVYDRLASHYNWTKPMDENQ